MNEVIPGQVYTVGGLQTIKFIHNTPEGLAPGTTVEELLELVIKRIEYLQTRVPCNENVEAIENLHNALNILGLRTLKRAEQGLTNKPVVHVS